MKISNRLLLIGLLVASFGQVAYGAQEDVPLEAVRAEKGYTNNIFDAIYLNDLNALQYWIDQGEIEAMNEDDITPLGAAMVTFSENIIRLLARNGANLERLNENGNTPLWSAVLRNQPAMVKLLVELGANKDVKDNGMSLLDLALLLGYSDTVEFLKEQGVQATFSQEGEKEIQADEGPINDIWGAIARADIGSIQHWIDQGQLEAVNEDGLTPLDYAIIYNNLGVVKFLVEHGANVKAVDRQGDTPLLIAAAQGIDIIQYLMDQGLSIETKGGDGDTPLLRAAAVGNIDAVKFLVEHGANIEARCNEGATPLLHAATEGSLDIVTYLIEQGADLTVVDNEGHNALGAAAQGGHYPVVSFLIGRDSSLVTKKNALDVLWTLAQEQDVALIAQLAERGFTLETLNDEGDTLLTQLVVDRDYDTIQFLIDQGANPYIFDKSGYNAFDYAQEDPKMLALLSTTAHEPIVGVREAPQQDDLEKIIRRTQFIDRTANPAKARRAGQQEADQEKEGAELAESEQTQTMAHWNTHVPLDKVPYCSGIDLIDSPETLTYGEVTEELYGKVLQDPLTIKVLAQEKIENNTGNYVFYRAEPGKYRVYRYFTESIFRIMKLYGDKVPFVWNRFYKDAAKVPTINEYIKPENARAHKIGPKELNVLLSANLALFGNLCNEGESTWHYFNENFEAPTGAVEVKAMFERFFEYFGFDTAYIPQLLALGEGTISKSATLQQVVIPKAIVDDVAMLATYGYAFPWPEKVDEESWDENAINYDFSVKPLQGRHTKISPILDKYKNGQITIDDRWQARILLNELQGLDPRGGIKIYSYTRIPEKILQDLQTKVNNSAAQVFKSWLENALKNPKLPRGVQGEALADVLKHLGKNELKKRRADWIDAIDRVVQHYEYLFNGAVRVEKNIKIDVETARQELRSIRETLRDIEKKSVINDTDLLFVQRLAEQAGAILTSVKPEYQISIPELKGGVVEDEIKEQEALWQEAMPAAVPRPRKPWETQQEAEHVVAPIRGAR